MLEACTTVARIHFAWDTRYYVIHSLCMWILWAKNRCSFRNASFIRSEEQQTQPSSKMLLHPSIFSSSWVGTRDASIFSGAQYQCFFSWRTGAKFHPELGRRNHHNRSLQLQIARHCYWMRYKVASSDKENFGRFWVHNAGFHCFDSFLKSFYH